MHSEPADAAVFEHTAGLDVEPGTQIAAVAVVDAAFEPADTDVAVEVVAGADCTVGAD